ncbi:MAG TPA: UDP-N-acetylmuramoyl-L-alanyl-D-glutamate--2,6-diaminopimelate ligase [Spirochaetes bacterium]|nr:UDP-N-acetylmuramoyl-L-alanyl-D-glutamate--2,6-diaminopimelate ligase [Spirochaetota bacterium]
MAMKLSAILESLTAMLPPERTTHNGPLNDDPLISGIENDSRKVSEKGIFVAIKGYQSDGHHFIDSAIQSGASCLVIDDLDYDTVYKKYQDALPILSFKNTRKALALLSRLYYDNPGQKLKLIGVTGTNGKTTITYMIREILRKAGRKVGLLGTICNYIDDKKIKSPVTTPDSLELNRLFHEMVNKGIQYAVMEVSSHALYLDRVYGLDFDCVIFTNLSEDHLDFHKDMDEYLRVKELIFDVLSQSTKHPTLAVVNQDLDFSDRLISKAQRLKLNYKTYGLTEQADYYGTDIHFSLSNSAFIVKNGTESQSIEIPMPGRFNIYNTLASFAAVRFLGIPLADIVAGFKDISVPGRFEMIQSGNGAFIVIDYAHTDDAIQNVLSTLRDLKPRRIISVFGSGGDRDKGKRPLMGEVSGKMSDLTIVTSDNPRTEDPNLILDDIIVGINRVQGKYIKIESRYEAIKEAIHLSEEGDIVLIAGKGHEDYQILKDKTIHFDDKEAVEDVLKNRFQTINRMDHDS